MQGEITASGLASRFAVFSCGLTSNESGYRDGSVSGIVVEWSSWQKGLTALRPIESSLLFHQ